MRRFLGGMITGGLVSVIGLGAASVIGETPAGVTPPRAPQVDAPLAADVGAGSDSAQETIANEPEVALQSDVDDGEETLVATAPVDAPNPVGSLTVLAPQTPELPDDKSVPEASNGSATQEPAAPALIEPEARAPSADTSPLSQPVILSVSGAMDAPTLSSGVNLIAEEITPVLPNPLAQAPQTPLPETDLTVSTRPAAPAVRPVENVDEEAAVTVEPTVIVADLIDALPIETEAPSSVAAEAEDFFVVDLGAGAAEFSTLTQVESEQVPVASDPLIQLGGENSLLNDERTDVVIRRPGLQDDEEAVVSEPNATEAAPQSALAQYASVSGDTMGKPMVSVVLIDDGSMDDPQAALAGLPFNVTIALDPALPDAAEQLELYREDGHEIVLMASLPEGALPSDVEITFESIFTNLTDTIGLLDIGEGGLQSDEDVAAQAMEFLASQGRGLVSVGQGLNMATRAAGENGVPSVTVARQLDGEDQDARTVGRFLERAAFTARQGSDVVLVGRVRPETLTALISWGNAVGDTDVALVPVSAVLLSQ